MRHKNAKIDVCGFEEIASRIRNKRIDDVIGYHYDVRICVEPEPMFMPRYETFNWLSKFLRLDITLYKVN